MSQEELDQIREILADSKNAETLIRRMRTVMREVLVKRKLPVPFSSLLGLTQQKLLLQLLKRYKVPYQRASTREEIMTFAWLVLAKDRLPDLLKRQLAMPWRKLASAIDDMSINDLADYIISYENQSWCSRV